MEVELRWSPLSGSPVLWEVYIHHTGFSRHMQTLADNSVGHTHLPFFSPDRTGTRTFLEHKPLCLCSSCAHYLCI